MTLRTLSVSDTTSLLEILQQIDNRLFLIGSGDPDGVIAASMVGQIYFDIISTSMYICTSTDETPQGTIWKTVITLNLASLVAAGLIYLASGAEVTTGSNNTKAVTPYTLSQNYARIDHNHALSTLTDTLVSGLADGDQLVYDLASGKWKNLTAASLAYNMINDPTFYLFGG